MGRKIYEEYINNFESFLGEWNITLEELYIMCTDRGKKILKKAAFTNTGETIDISGLFIFMNNTKFINPNIWYAVSNEWSLLNNHQKTLFYKKAKRNFENGFKSFNILRDKKQFSMDLL